MRNFEMHFNCARWDRFREFHCQNGGFVEFNDGSLLFEDSKPPPHMRKYFEKYDVTISATGDADCPKLFEDEARTKPVPKAWVTASGHQYIAVDHTQGVAVRLGRSYWDVRASKNACLVPANKARSAFAYWPKADVRPIPLSQIALSKPDRDLSKKMAPILDAVRAAASAAHRINPIAGYMYPEKVSPSQEWADADPSELIAQWLSEGVRGRFFIARIADFGFTTPRREENVDFLYAA